MLTGCIGEKLPHSFSKIIHEKIGPDPYSLIELKPEDVGPFLQKKEFRAVNVTIPYKQTVIPYLDYISETAHTIGAVNTIVNHGGKLFGYNTDQFGLRALIERLQINISNKKVLILGSGGTSRTAKYVANALGAKEILIVSRNPLSMAAVSYEDAKSKHADAQIIINTTPVGMYPDCFASQVNLSDFPALEGIVDAVYNPLSTVLVREASKRGIRAGNGLYMLVAQAVRAFELFNAATLPDAVTERVYSEVLREKQNIVLTGMPGSGKSTIGKILAKKTGRTLFDTDTLIVQKAGKPIPELISEKGEPFFRDLETQLIRELAPLSGIIIATGGGSVLRDENIDLLKMNGKLYFRDRPISYIMPTADRPLSADRDALERRYRERIGIYRSTADEIIFSGNSLNGAAYEIERRHFGENTDRKRCKSESARNP